MRRFFEVPYCLDDYDFIALAKAEGNKRIYQRLMMLAYLKEGMSKAQVSRLTFTAPDRVYAWLKRFHEQGIQGLSDKPRSGRPRLLDCSAHGVLKQKIEQSQSSLSEIVFASMCCEEMSRVDAIVLLWVPLIHVRWDRVVGSIPWVESVFW